MHRPRGAWEKHPAPKHCWGSRRLNSSRRRAGTQKSLQTRPQSCRQEDLGIRFSFHSATQPLSLQWCQGSKSAGGSLGQCPYLEKTSAQRRKGTKAQQRLGSGPWIQSRPLNVGQEAWPRGAHLHWERGRSKLLRDGCPEEEPDRALGQGRCSRRAGGWQQER